MRLAIVCMCGVHLRGPNRRAHNSVKLDGSKCAESYPSPVCTIQKPNMVHTRPIHLPRHHLSASAHEQTMGRSHTSSEKPCGKVLFFWCSGCHKNVVLDPTQRYSIPALPIKKTTTSYPRWCALHRGCEPVGSAVRCLCRKTPAHWNAPQATPYATSHACAYQSIVIVFYYIVPYSPTQ